MINLQNAALLTALVFVILFPGCARKPEEKAVATVGSQSVTFADYLDRYAKFLGSTDVRDNLLTRHMFLQTLIDEHLLLEWADTTGMIHHPAHRTALEEIHQQILLNKLYQHNIKSRISTGEDELRTLYRWSGTRVHARHLFAPREETAQELYRRLTAGDKWETLASDAFQDPVLAATGGDLGFFEMGDMDPAFEVAAFQLRDGEISPPVKTWTGYSVIQVLEREIDPFLTEDEFRLKIPWLEQMALSYQKRPAVRAYTDSVKADLDIQFQEPGIGRLWDQRELITPVSDELVIMDARLPCVRFGDRGELWTVGDAIPRLRGLSPRQKGLIATKDNLEQALAGLIVQERLLEKAKHLALDTTRVFDGESRRARDGYLISRIIQLIYDQVPDPSERRTAFIEFRDGLKNRTSISIDSTLIGQFILN